MKEYIEREAALDIAVEWCPDDDGSVGKTGDLREMLDELEAIPAADVVTWDQLKKAWAIATADVVEVRHGRWERVDYGNGLYNYHCSSCRHIPRENIRSNYCPNCGARMDMEEDI